MCQNLWPIQDLPVKIRGVFEISNFNQFYTILANRKTKYAIQLFKMFQNAKTKEESKEKVLLPKPWKKTFFTIILNYKLCEGEEEKVLLIFHALSL